MDYFVILCSIGLLFAFGFYVGHPLISSERLTPQQSRVGVLVRELVERKRQLYSAIKELEFDQALGKLATNDFEHLRRDLENEALKVIRRLDQINGPTDIETLRDSIESDILALRQNTSRSIPPCPNCTAPRQVEDRFCSHCGTHLEELAGT